MDQKYNEKYDRQIRVWGQHGQNKFSEAKVCLINANALGTEILKGLCLAGIGSFTILDCNKITQDDIDVNFFVSQNTLSKSRADVAKQFLLDLNEDVVGNVEQIEIYLPHQEPPKSNEEVSERIKQFWRQFNVVIICGNLYVDQIVSLSRICWTYNIPLIHTKSIGFFGSAQIQVKEHKIIDMKPGDKATIEESDTDAESNDGNNYMRTNSLYQDWLDENREVIEHFDEDLEEYISIYLGLIATDFFFSNYSRMPGLRDCQVESDLTKLKDYSKTLIGKSRSILKCLDQYLYEICRTGIIELHTTSAFLGGCIAQEIFKLVTNNYQPVNNILVYSCIAGIVKCFKYDDIFITKKSPTS